MENNYRIEKEGDKITFWNDTAGVGIRFQEGEMLSRYTHEILLKDMSLLTTTEKIKTMEQAVAGLKKAAAAAYPKEFKPIK